MEEREDITIELELKKTLNEIGRELKRHRSTISREISTIYRKKEEIYT